MKLADFYLPFRLCFNSWPEWHSLAWPELSTAIRYFDGAALFLLDRGALSALDETSRAALIERDPIWATAVRDLALLQNTTSVLTARERSELSRLPTFELQLDA